MNWLHNAFLGLLLVAPVVAQGEAMPAASSGGGAPRGAWERGLDRLRLEPDPLVLQASLEGLQREYPGRVKVEVFGQSRAGRPLYALRLEPENRAGAPAVEALPMTWVVPDMDARQDPAGMLAAANRWLQSTPMNSESGVCLIPLPNPDLWIDGAKVGAVQLEQNFPVGWSPWVETHRNPGPAPLSEPETKALIAWLLEHPSVMGLMRWTQDQTPSSGSTLEAYAAEILGLPCVTANSLHPDPMMQGLAELDRLRDRLEGKVLAVKRLSETLWCVDLSIRNLGQHALTGRPVPMRWQILGGVGKAAAVAPEGQNDPSLLIDPGSCRIPAVGTEMLLRLVVQSTGSEQLFVSLDCARLPNLTLAVPLQKASSPPAAAR